MIVALHGFLGLARDWSPFRELKDLHAIDLWPSAGGDSPDAFETWATSFTARLPKDEKPILMGYSLGGRLAMHALVRAPEKFRAAILISANPGLTNEAEREPRRANDRRWAERFRHEPWAEVVHAWNKQPVLRPPSGVKNSIKESRREADFDRARLAWALERWSLAEQRDLRAELSRVETPILYLSGSEDAKFTPLLSALPLGSSHRREVIHGAGHRLPWDQPAAFVETASQFLASLPRDSVKVNH